MVQGLQPLAAVADAIIGAAPGLAGASAGWVAGILERNPDALLPYGISPQSADRAQREFHHAGTALLAELGSRVPAYNPFEGLPGRAPRETPPAPPPDVVQPSVRNQDWTGPPASIREARPPAQGAFPLGPATPLPYDVRTGEPPLSRAQIGGGERQLGLPLESARPAERPGPTLPWSRRRPSMRKVSTGSRSPRRTQPAATPCRTPEAWPRKQCRHRRCDREESHRLTRTAPLVVDLPPKPKG